MDTDYGVLKCRILETTQIKGITPHFHIHAIAEDVHFRIAINIKSESYPYDVLYYIDYDFHNELTTKLSKLPFGFYPLSSTGKKEYGLDYIRGNLLDINKMQPLSDVAPGPDNDLNEKIREITHKALQNQDTVLYAFGRRWEPAGDKDKYFNFSPSNGIHFIHMNQDRIQSEEESDSSWQDGGLLVNFVHENKWNAIFWPSNLLSKMSKTKHLIYEQRLLESDSLFFHINLLRYYLLEIIKVNISFIK